MNIEQFAEKLKDVERQLITIKADNLNLIYYKIEQLYNEIFQIKQQLAQLKH